MKHVRDCLPGLIGLLLLVGCAAKRPVLYPNAKLKSTSVAVAEQDIEACLEMARAAGASKGHGGELAGEAAGTTAAGSATGAAAGSIYGSAGQGAAAGAAAGATAGLFRGLFKAREGDPVFRRFVEKCLQEKGYEPIGWK